MSVAAPCWPVRLSAHLAEWDKEPEDAARGDGGPRILPSRYSSYPSTRPCSQPNLQVHNPPTSFACAQPYHPTPLPPNPNQSNPTPTGYSSYPSTRPCSQPHLQVDPNQRCRSVFNIGGYLVILINFGWFLAFRGCFLTWNSQNSELLGWYITISPRVSTPLIPIPNLSRPKRHHSLPIPLYLHPHYMQAYSITSPRHPTRYTYRSQPHIKVSL